MGDEPYLRSRSTPTFADTSPESPIAHVALALRGHKGDASLCSGTGVVVGTNLAITAAHVIDDMSQQLDRMLMPKGLHEASFHLDAFQVLPGGQKYELWSITRVWVCRFTDIALLRLSPTTVEGSAHSWTTPKIRLGPPDVGARVAAFGYAGASYEKDAERAFWNVKAHTAVGFVKEVHYERRDAVRLSFPCYRVNARFDGGMSGGPVFNDEGELCGLVCSNLPPQQVDDEHVSYVTTLWPLMGLMVDMDRQGHPTQVSYPVLDLARDAFLQAVDINCVSVRRDGSGDVEGVSFLAG